MAQIVANSKALAKALHDRGITVLGAHKGFTETHQVIVDVKKFGGGLDVAHKLAKANIITNKNLIPSDKPDDWDYPSGLRIGTIEITRLGMKEAEMDIIADYIVRALENQEPVESVRKRVIEMRTGYQKIHYCFD
ncbi:hypothetical protein [Bacillus sp. MUM 116]|uniref:hypothetical protein n=1 Tax=Bacillus sp. MUM 116 TaxID=1678002 RepID=UPI000A60EC16|nr:hypothetical protein [Bacillus sp. MUM 116]